MNTNEQFPLGLSDEQLIVLIGERLERDSFGLSPNEIVKVGREWWEANVTRLKAVVVRSDAYKAYKRQPEKWGDAELLAAIADVISGVVGIVPVAVVAVLVLRRVLRNLGDDETNSP